MVGEAADSIESHREAGSIARVDGLRLFYRHEGPPGGIPVVLTHGIPRSSFLYRKILPILSRSHSVIAWDLYGAGLSEKPPERERYSFDEFERIFGAFLDSLGIECAHLVCHDVGGPYTMGFAARNQDRVASLTVMNTTLTVAGFRIPAPVAAAVVLPPALQKAFLPDARFVRFLYAYMHRWAHASGFSEAEAEIDQNLLLRDGGRLGLIRTLQAYRGALAYFRGVHRDLVGFDRPSTVLWGARDPFCRVEAGRRISTALGCPPPLLIEEASHYLQEDEPERVALAILRCIEETER